MLRLKKPERFFNEYEPPYLVLGGQHKVMPSGTELVEIDNFFPSKKDRALYRAEDEWYSWLDRERVSDDP